MSNMKDGKVPMSDREKYRQMATSTGSILTVPDVLVKAFADAGLVSKWVSKAKIASHGGYHPSNWIPYEMTAEQKKELPKVFLGNVVTGHLERGDLILAVKPKEMQDDHKKDIRRKTRQQLDSLYQEKDAEGKVILAQPE
jgi:hypothetical protein